MATLKNHPGAFLNDAAARDFNRAEDERGVLQLNEAGRTIATQQGYIDRWNKGGAANRPPFLYRPAMPATASNHVKNGGEAVDIANFRVFAPYCGQYGFVHSFPSSDPVHFDHVGLAPSGNPGANQVTKDRQNRCLQLGISVGPHGADGIEGKDTKAAYKEYQLRLVPYGYPATMIDGIWGPKMQAAHTAMLAAEAAASVQGTSNLARGSKGAAVKALQEKLARVYPAYQTQHGKLFADGDFGAITEAWVKEFQRRSGLKDDGIVGPQTRKALGL